MDKHAIFSILDSQTKLECLEFILCQIYGEFDDANLYKLAIDATFGVA